MLAAGRGHINAVQKLLEAVRDDRERSLYASKALHNAAMSRKVRLVDLLIKAGAEVGTRGGRFGNALQAASYGDNKEMVQVLLEAGADVNARGGRYNNALQAASRGGHNEVVQVLLEAGADANMQSRRYRNALHCALSNVFLNPRDIMTAQILLGAGATSNFTSEEYYQIGGVCSKLRYILKEEHPVLPRESQTWALDFLDKYASIAKVRRKRQWTREWKPFFRMSMDTID